MGDSGDNVIGLKGVGKVGANKLLADCNTEEECVKVAKQAYLNNAKNKGSKKQSKRKFI